jgi:hypothetical protein
MDKESHAKTLLHELVHLRQWVVGSLQTTVGGKMCYCRDPVEKYEYWYQPHEIEKHESKKKALYEDYIFETTGVSIRNTICRTIQRHRS